MKDNVELCNRITELFLNRMALRVPSPDTDLFEKGMLDSLMFVDLLLHLEKDFGAKCSLDDLDIDNFRTIRLIAQFVEARSASKPLHRVSAA